MMITVKTMVAFRLPQELEQYNDFTKDLDWSKWKKDETTKATTLWKIETTFIEGKNNVTHT